MPFELNWLPCGRGNYEELEAEASAAKRGRKAQGKTKSSKSEGLFKQLNKALRFLRDNPKHPGLQTHEYSSIEHPYDKDQKVFEAYVQNNAPGAYRVFWCYGPGQNQITIIAITPHP